MPTKKPAKSSAKAPAKKTTSAKAAPAKKSAQSTKAKVVAKSKAVAKKPAAKPVKAPAKPAAKASVKAAAKPAAKPASKPVAKATETKPINKPASAPPKAATPAAAPKRPEAKMSDKPQVVAIAERSKKPAPVVTDANDDEGYEASTNLLAGPRNVTPYQVKRGEQYMNKEQLDHFRQILSTWKRDLMEEVDRTVLHMKDEAANFPDPNDRATQESEFSLELRTRDRERKLIRKIDEAIARIDDGSYGYCIETGEEIGIKRLEARPVATLSVEAQERRERREKQYGERDDRYR